ncbi:MAG: flagellar export chaperone FliS [Firmicutes bacterium]|nr:flagellar export chaperone FliS [Bacillota bacterium]
MTGYSPYQQYQQNAVLSAPPEQWTLMLYNGALRFIKQAVEATEKKDVAAAHQAIVRAQDIISYLRETLRDGFAVSESLNSLYGYLLRRLVEANLRKDPAVLLEAAGLLEELKEAWETAILSLGRSAANG